MPNSITRRFRDLDVSYQYDASASKFCDVFVLCDVKSKRNVSQQSDED